MPPKKTVKTDAATFAKMLTDQGFAYKHIYETYQNDFSYNFNNFSLEAKGYFEEDLFQEFCTEKSTYNTLKSFNPEKGLFSTWINTVMFNYCDDKVKKHTIEEKFEHYDNPKNNFQLEDIIDEGVDYTYANELLKSLLKSIKNNDFRTILEDILIYGLAKEETIAKLGINIATYNTYKSRAIARCADILYKIGHIDEAQRDYILITRNRTKPADTFTLGFMAPGFMSNFEVIPMSGDRDIDWIMMKLRGLQ